MISKTRLAASLTWWSCLHRIHAWPAGADSALEALRWFAVSQQEETSWPHTERWLSADAGNSSLSEPECICPEEPAEDEGGALPLWLSLPAIVVLVLMSGLFSGLTLGLLGLDPIGLQMVQRGENQELAKCAEKIAPVRAKGNQLLCTLLLGNVAVNSALAILTASLFDGLAGFLGSTALIVIFGEILPQATCARYALQIGAVTTPLVKVLMILFWVLTKPMSAALDCILGREVGTVHSSQELLEMLKLQIRMGATDAATGEIARQVAEGALSFRDKKVDDVMTPMDDTYMLSTEARLGYELIREIFETGYSRVPVYGKDKHDFRGLLNSKDLMLADPEDQMKVGDFIYIFNRRVENFKKDTLLVHVLNAFKKGGTHMGLVREEDYGDPTAPKVEIVGILTLEDIMEEILQEEIVDETDVYVDVDRGVRVADGREKRILNLGVFNPVWKTVRKDRLSGDEVNAIAAHLSQTAFGPTSGMHLSLRAIQWIVSVAEVQNKQKCTPDDVEEPQKEDWLYFAGQPVDRCTVVLQGQLGQHVGKERFRSTASAFSVVAKCALKQDSFTPDFGAFVSSKQVRMLVMTRPQFLEAQELARDAQALETAMSEIAEVAAGEVSRIDAKTLRERPDGNHRRSPPNTYSQSPSAWGTPHPPDTSPSASPPPSVIGQAGVISV